MPTLTQDDLSKCRRAFKKLDHDNDGSMQVHELRYALRDCCNPSQIDAIIESADADKSGRIDFAEFLRIAQTSFPESEGVTAPALKDLLPDEFSNKRGTGEYGSSISPETESYTDLMGTKNLGSQRNNKNNVCCFCIPLLHPNSYFANVWQLVTAFAILYAALMTPVLLAFEDQLTGDSREQVLQFDSGVNAIFMVDVIVQFCSMYHDSKGDLVSSPRRIAIRYLSGWFLPDVISCIPLEFIMGKGPGGGGTLLYAKLARMGKMARVLRLLKMLKMLKLVRLVKFYANFDRIFSKAFNDKYEDNSSKAYQFIKFCILALLVAHVAGCLWYALAKFHESMQDTWVVGRGIEDAEILDQYLQSMYFIITTLTTVGYGDISASTNAEIIVAILLMMGGVLGYSIAVGTVSSVLMQEDQRQSIINNKMQTLAHFAKETDMDVKEYGKIKRHINQKYTGSLDWMEHLTGPAQLQSLLADLPVVLRAKMLRHMHHGRHLKLEFFHRYKDDDLFAYMVPNLASDHFTAHDMIYLRGDYAERIYFLTKGTVVFFIFERLEKSNDLEPGGISSPNMKRRSSQMHMLDKRMYEEIEKDMLGIDPFQIIVDGSTFGDFEVLLGIPRQQCVRCDTESECLRLHKKDLLRTLAEFPTLAECMRRDAKHEYHMTLKRKKAFADEAGIRICDPPDLFPDEYDETGDEIRPEPPPDPPKLPPLPRTDDSNGATPALGVENRLSAIERRQQELLHKAEHHDKTLKDMQAMLFSIDLRIQSMVLRT